jgi:cellulose synthase/poly-beta-1,6-N-acetylglucosamine synthase-like glycosyltransferase
MHVLRSRSKLPHLLIGFGLGLAVLSVPSVGGRVLGGALILTGTGLAALLAMQISSLIPRRGQRRPRQLAVSRELPFVSVHVAVQDEEPGQLRRTLQALARLTYPADRYEVIVLNAQGAPSQLERSLESCCRALGKSFRFHQMTEGGGSKVAALNTARRLMHPKASLIAAVDGDFEAAPHGLRLAVAAMDSREISHVQFPQDFRDAVGGRKTIANELQHFFNLYAQSAGTGILPVGAFCVFRRGALAEVGGWQDSTIAEGTELGTRLLAAGFHGRYVGVASGTIGLPANFPELANLRFRRAAGSAQCLKETCRFGRIPRTGLGNFWRMLQQLSAWLDLQALALALSLVALAGSFLTSFSEPFPQAFAAAMGLWLVAVVVGALPVLLGTKGGLGDRLRACMVHQALAPEASWGTVQGLLRAKLPLLTSRDPVLVGSYGHSPARASSASPLLAFAFVLPMEFLLPVATLGAVAFFQITLRRYASIALTEDR